MRQLRLLSPFFGHYVSTRIVVTIAHFEIDVANFQANGLNNKPTVLRSFLREPRSVENKMTSLGMTRKLDSVGRIVIPKKLREQLHLLSDVEYQFFLHEDQGHKYLCLECPAPNESELAYARKLLENAGFQIT